MPGAFTKTCSVNTFTGYKKLRFSFRKRVQKILCIAVNDPNVMKAWGESQMSVIKF